MSILVSSLPCSNVKKLLPVIEDELLIVLVIYEMKLADSPAFISLRRALEFSNRQPLLFVYDNSVQSQVIPKDTQWVIFYQHNPINAGVSKAYNEGAKLAQEKDKKWLLLGDQDTEFPIHLFNRFNRSVNNQTQELYVPIMNDAKGIVSPFRYQWGRGMRVNSLHEGVHSFTGYRFINSGMLISTSLFNRCGGYDERFPLDFSDLAFINRIIIHQNEFMLVDINCNHRLSALFDSPTQALIRFKAFATSSRLFGQENGTSWLQEVQLFLRAITLSIRFMELKFIFIFFKRE